MDIASHSIKDSKSLDYKTGKSEDVHTTKNVEIKISNN